MQTVCHVSTVDGNSRQRRCRGQTTNSHLRCFRCDPLPSDIPEVASAFDPVAGYHSASVRPAAPATARTADGCPIPPRRIRLRGLGGSSADNPRRGAEKPSPGVEQRPQSLYFPPTITRSRIADPRLVLSRSARESATSQDQLVITPRTGWRRSLSEAATGPVPAANLPAYRMQLAPGAIGGRRHAKRASVVRKGGCSSHTRFHLRMSHRVSLPANLLQHHQAACVIFARCDSERRPNSLQVDRLNPASAARAAKAGAESDFARCNAPDARQPVGRCPSPGTAPPARGGPGTSHPPPPSAEDHVLPPRTSCRAGRAAEDARCSRPY
jgi:hypothetical protein